MNQRHEEMRRINQLALQGRLIGNLEASLPGRDFREPGQVTVKAGRNGKAEERLTCKTCRAYYPDSAATWTFANREAWAAHMRERHQIVVT